MPMNEEKPLVFIDSIKTDSLPLVRATADLNPIFTALKPLGIIGKAIIAIMAYRIEAKRIKVEESRVDVEITRIRKQSKVAQSYIDAELKIKLKKLDNQREQLLLGFKHIEKVLNEQRTTKETLRKSLDNIQNVMNNLYNRNPLPDAKIFEIYREIIEGLTSKMVELEINNVNQITTINISFFNMVGDTKRDLLSSPKKYFLK